jgi:hypothetical protein
VVPFPLRNFSELLPDTSIDYDLLAIDQNNTYGKFKDVDYLKLYPRYIQFNEIQMLYSGFPIQTININKSIYYHTIWLIFWMVNYGDKPLNNLPLFKSEEVIGEKTDNSIYADKFTVSKEAPSGNVIRIGLANVQVNTKNFSKILKGESIFYESSRETVNKIINQAIFEKVDLLVMPECFIHYSWIDKLIRISRDHQMAMVFGLEHLVINKTVYNFAVTLLPFRLGKFTNCAFEMRVKNHYSPFETSQIEGEELYIPDISSVRKYTLYKWHNFCFSPYICYEIASIEDRAIFKSMIDGIVVIECNKDIAYFSNIIEALSRDLHCFCIQSNSSNYGDNRITQPTKQEIKDKVRAKGGINDYLIVDTIDFGELRHFQSLNKKEQKTYEEINEKFKPTPPGFDNRLLNER